MAVSQVSQVIRSSPYQLSLDLGLFSKVLEAKQAQFNQGAAKAQAGIDALAQLDVMRDSDRQYLNQKINGLVEGINSLGGVDYSDMGIQNQIEGLGSDIYGDNAVLTAVSSTRSARNLINQYENFKNNPKLKGYYSEVNETLDKEKINQWIQNPNVGAAYTGPSSATPYEEYQKSLAKQMEKLQADKYTYMQDKGLYFEKESGTFVTPERVKQAAIDLMTPAQQAQMRRDGIYQFKYLNKATPEQIINKAVGQFQEQLNNAKSLQAHYKSLADAAVSDPISRQKYLQLAESQGGEVGRLNNASRTVGQKILDSYKNDPEGLMGELYVNDFTRGLANVYSYNRVDRSIQADQGEMFQLRQAEDQRQFNLTYNQKERFEQSKESIELRKAGLKYETDANGNRQLKKIPAGEEGSLETPDNIVQDSDDFKISEAGLLKQNQASVLQINQLDQNTIASLAASNPNMFNKDESDINPGGILYSLKYQKDLEDLNGERAFQMSDLAALDDPKNVNKVKAKGHLTDSDIKQLQQWSKDYRALTRGEQPSSKLPEAFVSNSKKIQLLQLGINSNNAKIKSVTEAAVSRVQEKAGLTDKESAIYKDYLANPDKYNVPVNYYSGVGAGGFGMGTSGTWKTTMEPNEEIRRIRDKINKSGVNLKPIKDALYKAASTGDVRFGRSFSEDEIKQRGTEFQNYIVTDALANGINPLQGAAKLKVGDFEAKNIRPVRNGISSDGRPYIDYGITTGSDGKQTQEYYRTYLSEKNAASMGVYADPYEEINRAVHLTGSAAMTIHGGNRLAFDVKIMKNNPNNVNDQSSRVFIYGGGGTYIPIPGSDGRNPSEAFANAEAVIKDADAKGVERQDLILRMSVLNK